MRVRRALLTSPRRRTAGAWLACLLALALCPGMASALTIESFETSRTGMDGTPATQAGAHPSLIASFAFAESGGPEAPKNVRLGLPQGFFVSPGAVPDCGAASFAAFECPSSTQVGLITLRADHEGDPSHLLGTAPVYALAPAAGEIAHLGFIAPLVNLPVEIPVTVRSSSDYGLDLTFRDLPQAAALTEASLFLWDVPAEPSYDSQRFAAGSPGAPAGCPGVEGTSCIVGSNPVNVASLPLLHNPTTCVGPLTSTLDVTTHQHPSVVHSTIFTDTIGTSGCNNNAFSPSLLAGLTTAQTRSPSGLALELHVIDEGFANPTGIAQAQIRSASVALPPGLEIDSAAGGLSTCTDAQFAAGSAVPSSCPSDSEVGAFSMAVAGLDEALDGTAYFGDPEPDGTYRLFLAASGPSFDTKLVGLLEPASVSEPVTVALPSLPQLPLEALELELAGDSELLVTPVKCGAYQAKATLAPWSSPGAPSLLTTSAISLTLTGPDGGPCPGPASGIDLALSPASILADGSSTSLATATLTDADEIRVPGDEIVFSSTDPGQRIGAVTDNEDGTYTARITASTAAGTQTITATDATVGSGVFGTASLIQLAPGVARLAPIAGPPPTAPAPRPRVTLEKTPPRQTHDRTPSFRFSSSAPGSRFSCRVDGQPAHRCASPKTLPKLGFGGHTFSVRATDPIGGASEPAAYRFTVRKPRAS